MFARVTTKTIKCIMHVKSLTFLLLFALCLLPLQAKAQCDNPTCISMEMVGTGQNALVDNSEAVPNAEKITGRDPASPGSAVDCSKSPMVKTGVKIYRLYAPSKQPEFKDYDEQFCLSQGCSLQGGLLGDPECRTEP